MQALREPAAYPQRADAVEIRQTHISVVFLVGPYVYKIKKPVSLGFLDFSTLERRHHFCQEEVRLNRRLAADVYLDVVPIVRRGSGVEVEGHGEPIEWAVKMRRLDDRDTLEHRLARHEVDAEAVEKLARRVAAFHASADRGEHIAQFGRLEVVERNARENLEALRTSVGTAVSAEVFARLNTLLESQLAQLGPLVEDRAQRGVPCDTHGDLRLDHVYLLPDRAPPNDVLIIDCIEFNERFRYADPVADMAFAAMGLKLLGRGDLARVFVDAYFQTSHDVEGRTLVPFYTAYRAAVRGKVELIRSQEPEVPEADRAAALEASRAFWLLALGELETRGKRPCLVAIGGLSGTGKSTLAVELAARAGFTLIRSDVVRKELAGASGTSMAAEFGQGIYTPEWTERTYAECLRRARQVVFEGGRAMIDASFREDARRVELVESATSWGVPVVCVECQADPQIVRQRLAARSGDASDADWSIYQQAAASWVAPSTAVSPYWHAVDSGGTREDTVLLALKVLEEAAV